MATEIEAKEVTVGKFLRQESKGATQRPKIFSLVPETNTIQVVSHKKKNGIIGSRKTTAEPVELEARLDL